MSRPGKASSRGKSRARLAGEWMSEPVTTLASRSDKAGLIGPCVRPAKAGAFSGSQSRQGKSQKPCSLDSREEGNRMT